MSEFTGIYIGLEIDKDRTGDEMFAALEGQYNVARRFGRQLKEAYLEWYGEVLEIDYETTENAEIKICILIDDDTRLKEFFQHFSDAYLQARMSKYDLDEGFTGLNPN